MNGEVDGWETIRKELEAAQMRLDVAIAIVPLMSTNIAFASDRKAIVVDVVDSWLALSEETRLSYFDTERNTQGITYFSWEYVDLIEQTPASSWEKPVEEGAALAPLVRVVPKNYGVDLEYISDEDLLYERWTTHLCRVLARQAAKMGPAREWVDRFPFYGQYEQHEDLESPPMAA